MGVDGCRFGSVLESGGRGGPSKRVRSRRHNFEEETGRKMLVPQTRDSDGVQRPSRSEPQVRESLRRVGPRPRVDQGSYRCTTPSPLGHPHRRREKGRTVQFVVRSVSVTVGGVKGLHVQTVLVVDVSDVLQGVHTLWGTMSGVERGAGRVRGLSRITR